MSDNNLQLQVLSYLKRFGESHTNDIHGHFQEFENRRDLSAFLGNLKTEGLISKNNPGRWSLTGIGRAALEDSGYPLHEVKTVEGGKHKKAADIGDLDRGICDTSRQQSLTPFDMAKQLQHAIPNGSSLVIEADEIFLAWRGAHFAIQKPEDLQAFQAIQEAYIGEVA